jgi:hypothetical protein
MALITDKKRLDKKAKDKFLSTAREQFRTTAKAWGDIRDKSLDDRKFAAGQQWPESIKNERDDDNRPMLTINKLNKFIKRVVGEQRQNRPEIKYRPVDSVADPDQAQVRTEIARHIQQNSNAIEAYDTAFESALKGGFGWWRVDTEYTGHDSFEQDIKINRIRNAFTVYYDISGIDFLHRDAKYAFVTEVVSRKEYKDRYGKEYLKSWDMRSAVGEEYINWFIDDKVRICEYFKVETENTTIYQFEDGSVVDLRDMEKAGVDMEELEMQGFKVVNEREAKVPVVIWAKISVDEILEGPRRLSSRHIPIVPVLGEEEDIDGRLDYVGLIRYAKDPQRMYNYWRTLATEIIALAPRAPFIATLANDVGVGRPKREQPSQIPTGVVNEGAISGVDISDTIGMYEASLGQKSNERTGKAIQERRSSSDLGIFAFFDNFAKSIMHTGVIINDMMPVIYDTERQIRIMGEDQTEKVLQVNKSVLDLETMEEVVINDLTVGKYDIVEVAGPSYATKRAEMADTMIEFMQYIPPEASMLIVDLIAKNLDFPNAEEIAQRLSALVPPQLAGQGQPEGAPPPGAGGPVAPPADQQALPL